MELISVAFAVLVIDYANRRRAAIEFKQSIIRQMASRSNDFALDAARIVKDQKWHRDGSLVNILLGGANLQGVNLWNANLQGAGLWRADLQAAILRDANLQNAVLVGASLQDAHLTYTNLRGADLQGADQEDASLKSVLYDNSTVWPDGFTPPDSAINWDCLTEEEQQKLRDERWYLRQHSGA